MNQLITKTPIVTCQTITCFHHSSICQGMDPNPQAAVHYQDAACSVPAVCANGAAHVHSATTRTEPSLSPCPASPKSRNDWGPLCQGTANFIFYIYVYTIILTKTEEKYFDSIQMIKFVFIQQEKMGMPEYNAGY